MDHFHYKQGIYHAEDVSLARIAEEIGTPFYCYSTATLTRHYNVFASHFAGMDTKICYATKANSNLAVIKTLAKLGAGADVVSEGEIRLALAAGVNPNDIVFSGVGKTAAEMAYALDAGIYQFNVESEPELLLLNEVALSKNAKARIAIRVNPDVDPKTHAKISTGQKESKFGVPMHDALSLYVQAAELKGLDVQGVSMHIGSQLTKIEPFAQAFARLRAFVEELRAKNIQVRTVDVGGGLGIPYGEDEPLSPDDYAEVAKREMQGLGCQLIFEPGRMLVGNAGIMVTRVIYVKKSANRTFVIVDAGMNDLIRPTLYNAYHAVVPVQESKAKSEQVDLVGPVCETGDIFAEQRIMPLPKAGDLLAFRSCGAYGASMAGTYNARPLVAEVMVNGDQFAVVRPRQSYEDLIKRDKLPNWL
ncbi:MAG: diaminopimelate decarboxylase [Alphaproteobacteria bacterium]